MKAFSLWQPWAQFVAERLKRVETRSWATTYRGPLAIVSTLRPPATNYDPGARPRVAGWAITRLREPTGVEWAMEWPTGEPGVVRRVPLPLGAVVASCRLVDVVPIVNDCSTDMSAPPHVCRSGDVLLSHRPESDPFPGGETERDATDQLPFGDYSPGRYAWLLDEIAPTTERCPWCWGETFVIVEKPPVQVMGVCGSCGGTGLGLDYGDGDTRCRQCHGYGEAPGLEQADPREPCPVCEGAGKCDPVPARGKQGVWEWAP